MNSTNQRTQTGRTTRPGTPQRQTRQSGFTLIELLVVVAIIALLISILLPSLNRAREQVKATVCMANLRSMGQAFTMYAEQFKGLWPATVDSLNTQNRWPVPFHDAGIISAELSRYDENGLEVKAGGKSIFLCPSEKADRSIPDWNHTPGHTVDRVEIGGSYSYTQEVQRKGDQGKIELGSLNNPAYYRPVDQCRRTSEVFMVMENFRPIEAVGDHGWRFNSGAAESYLKVAFYVGYRDRFTGAILEPSERNDDYKNIGGRHSDKSNVLCVDTHVENRKPLDVTYNDVSWDRWTGYPDLPPGGK